jgi:phosphotransferase system IIB component
MADQLAGEIREAIRGGGGSREAGPLPGGPATVTIGNNYPDDGALLAALGGPRNVLMAQALAGRVRIGVADPAQVDFQAISRLGLRGVTSPHAGCVHLLTGMALSAAVAAALTQAIS